MSIFSSGRFFNQEFEPCHFHAQLRLDLCRGKWIPFTPIKLKQRTELAILGYMEGCHPFGISKPHALDYNSVNFVPISKNLY